MKKTILSLATGALILHSSFSIAGSWSYEGNTGPDYWGYINNGEFATCATGTEQSPIDLGKKAVDVDSLSKLKHQFNLTDLTVVNNGHTVQVNVDNGSTTQTEFGAQRLLQFHFHTPSENTVDGKAYPLEAHFVHASDEGVLSVVGVFYKEGKENPALAKILATAPHHKGTATSADQTLDINSVLGTKATQEYYRFSGSLTTPPCTEGVRWYVSQDIQSASAEQIAEFNALFHGGNARPVQPLNHRVLSETDD